LLRVTALVIKFAKCFKNKATIKKSPKKEPMRLSAEDLKETEDLWITSVQASSFSKEIAFLWHKGLPLRFTSHNSVYSIIKCKGRVNNSDLPLNSRNPILLPAKHEFVQLIIRDAHESVKHSSIRDTPLLENDFGF